ncbi:DKNYY domain-containing protein [Acetobacteraceae bacterium]|nr:DKNYY domain-containing protein [Candidatus Parcubacteria bacterium]
MDEAPKSPEAAPTPPTSVSKIPKYWWGIAAAFLVVVLAGSTSAYYFSKNSPPSILETSRASSTVPWIPLSQTNSIFFEKERKVYVLVEQTWEEEIVNADPLTFVVPDENIGGRRLAYMYAKDKNNVYYRSIISGEVRVIPEADLISFQAVAGQDDFTAQDKNHRYLADWIICEDVTKKTCEFWDGPGIQNGHWFPGVSTTTSQITDRKPILNERGEPNGWYSTDGRYIYVDETVVVGADLNTFVGIGGFRFARDKNYLYYYGKIYNGNIIADPGTFTHIGGVFYKDSENVYVFSVDYAQAISADVKTFKSLNDEYYGKDSTRVFFGIDTLEGADPKSFVVLNDRYGKDTSHVYCMENIVEGADVATFVISPTSLWTGQDKNHKYLQGEIVE